MRHLNTLFLLFATALLAVAKTSAANGTQGCKDTIRVLAIGNSFSEDGVEQYLYELAEETGVKMIIGNAYRGGQGFHSHWTDVTEQNNTFEYRKVTDGVRTNTPHSALSTIITDEPWDFITVQQVSQESGLTSTFEPYMTLLINYTDSLKTNSAARLGYHQTWAYAHDSTHGGFANYGNDQAVMYDSIRHAVQWAMEHHPELSFRVPCGTAIQNARTSYLGDNMNRDGYHLDYILGRYTAACTWLETVTGNNPEGLSFRPKGMDMAAALVCQAAAHRAVLAPDSVSNLADVVFSHTNDIKPSGLIKLNFGGSACADPAWNDITPDRRTYTWITDTKLNPTGILVTCSDAFSGTGQEGAAFSATRMLMPKEVSKSYVWGYAAGKFGRQQPDHSGGYTLSHMNPDLKYDITIFASRDNSQDLRETTFVVQGEDSYSENLEAANNTANTAVIKNVRPTQDGKIVIMAMPGIHNTHSNKFYYLNAIMLKAH